MSEKRIMRMPREIDIELTARCNLKCKYCYFFENENLDYIDLSTQEWTRFFDELGSIGVMKVTLAGGEPFFRKDKIIDIWQKNIALAELRNREKIQLADFEFCTGCDFTNYCTGNCPGLAFNYMQKVNHPCLDACYRNFLLQIPSLSLGSN